MSPITYTQHNFDKAYLVHLADELREKARGFTENNGVKINGTNMDFWKIARFEDAYIVNIMKTYGLSCKPRFYFQPAHTTIPPHKDHNTTCSWNVVLSPSPAPVTFEGVNYFYDQAILNTQREHWVVNGSEDRIILKMSFFDVSYDYVCSQITGGSE